MSNPCFPRPIDESGQRRIAPTDISQFIRLGGVQIELLDYASPGTFGEPHHRRNHLGLTHLSFWVDDVEARALELERCGGTILQGTRNPADDASVRILFLADPDGTRVELMAPVARGGDAAPTTG